MGVLIVGLGPGEPGCITRAAWDALASAEEVFLRTRVHPSVPHLPVGPVYHSFDELYQHAADFGSVYDGIVARLLDRAMGGAPVVYAVPGDPGVAEGTVTRLREACAQRGVAFKVLHGVSCIEPALAALGHDAAAGCQILDATDVAIAWHPPINPDRPALILQLYSRRLASDVKLTLMNQYPDELPVALIHAAGTPEQRVDHLPLYEIDRRDEVAHLTTLYVPPCDVRPGAVTSLEGFQQTIAQLRSPVGCPWDREQTHQSLRPYLLEETYEVLEALDADDSALLAEELGDLLLQIVLHAQIAVDDGEFHMTDVIRQIDAKIKRRHPHVWGDAAVSGPAAVVANWHVIKANERAEKGSAARSLLDGVPAALPALAQAHQYDQRARRVGFDWPSVQGVIAKLHEEIAEIQAAVSDEERFDEIGDLLLTAAVWARWLNVNPEDALRAANRRFRERFVYIETRLQAAGRPWESVSAQEMLDLWEEAKRIVHRSGEMADNETGTAHP